VNTLDVTVLDTHAHGHPQTLAHTQSHTHLCALPDPEVVVRTDDVPLIVGESVSVRTHSRTHTPSVAHPAPQRGLHPHAPLTLPFPETGELQRLLVRRTTDEAHTHSHAHAHAHDTRTDVYVPAILPLSPRSPSTPTPAHPHPPFHARGSFPVDEHAHMLDTDNSHNAHVREGIDHEHVVFDGRTREWDLDMIGTSSLPHLLSLHSSHSHPSQTPHSLPAHTHVRSDSHTLNLSFCIDSPVSHADTFSRPTQSCTHTQALGHARPLARPRAH